MLSFKLTIYAVVALIMGMYVWSIYKECRGIDKSPKEQRFFKAAVYSLCGAIVLVFVLGFIISGGQLFAGDAINYKWLIPIVAVNLISVFFRSNKKVNAISTAVGVLFSGVFLCAFTAML